MPTRRAFVGGSIVAALTAKIALGSEAVAKLPVAAIVTHRGPPFQQSEKPELTASTR